MVVILAQFDLTLVETFSTIAIPSHDIRKGGRSVQVLSCSFPEGFRSRRCRRRGRRYGISRQRIQRSQREYTGEEFYAPLPW